MSSSIPTSQAIWIAVLPLLLSGLITGGSLLLQGRLTAQREQAQRDRDVEVRREDRAADRTTAQRDERLALHSMLMSAYDRMHVLLVHLYQACYDRNPRGRAGGVFMARGSYVVEHKDETQFLELVTRVHLLCDTSTVAAAENLQNAWTAVIMTTKGKDLTWEEINSLMSDMETAFHAYRAAARAEVR